MVDGDLIKITLFTLQQEEERALSYRSVQPTFTSHTNEVYAPSFCA